MTTADAFDEFLRAVEVACPPMPVAKFGLGQVVRSTRGPLRGAVVDADPVWSLDEASYAAVSPYPGFHRDQVYYRILGDAEDEGWVCKYVPEGLLEADVSCVPLSNPAIGDYFTVFLGDRYFYVSRLDA